MKKIILIISSMVLAATVASAATLSQGTKELQFRGNFDLESRVGQVIDFSLGYGVFVADQLEVGVRANIQDDDLTTNWGLGLFSEYNFEMDSPWVPYVGLAMDYQDNDIDGAGETSTTDNALVIGGSLGVKYFLTENLAIDGSYVFDWATESIYFEDTTLTDTQSRFLFGLRFYFP